MFHSEYILVTRSRVTIADDRKNNIGLFKIEEEAVSTNRSGN